MPPIANVIENAFSPLITLFENIMVFIHDHIVPNGSWGLSIVGLTILIRALLVPLTFRQLKSMQEMQRLAPEIPALKAKYKEDKQRQQQELMKFYQENKINPLASCLPLLLQIPVFISLFYMLRTDLKKHICPDGLVNHYNAVNHLTANAVHKVAHLPTGFIDKTSCDSVAPHSAKFLFLPDITNKATGAALAVLIVLYVGSQLASTLIATETADPNQRRLMWALPIIFVIILYRYPAGLLVYWITTNMWTIGQQYLIRRHIGPVTPDSEPPPGAKNGKAEKKNVPPLAPAPVGAAAAAGSSSTPSRQPSSSGAPPRSPRKKKKRSGRRR